MRRIDAAVVGAGFGGLGAALALAEAGADVALFEALTYPGGCASTFARRGHRFEAGATLSAGLGPDQPLRRWLGRHGVQVDVATLDPALELRAPGLRLTVRPERAAFVDAFAALPGVPPDRVRAFFAEQARHAATLWALFDQPDLLPPLTPRAIARHLGRLPAYAALLPLVGRPLSALVARHGLTGCAPLTTWLDAICQITVQCAHDRAEAPFAIAAIDYFFHGVGHVRGGLGALAWAFVDAIGRAGGEVRMADRVQGLERDGGGWILRTRRETVRAERVFANVLPQALGPLAGLPDRAVRRRARRVESGWSACMLYLSVDDGCPLGPAPLHFEIVQDPGLPLDGGNHLLVSLGPTGDAERAPAGRRVATVSTHIDPKRYAADPAGVATLAQRRLRDGLAAHLPEIAEHIAMEMTGSPRTFERFTRRPGGLVGGVPRRAGLDHYLDLFPRPVAPGLHLVGDSALLGQSVLATALGGQRAATAALRGWAPGRRGARTPHRPHDPADYQDESR